MIRSSSDPDRDRTAVFMRSVLRDRCQRAWHRCPGLQPEITPGSRSQRLIQSRLRTRSASPAGRTRRSSSAAAAADKSLGAPPASSSRSSASSWLTSRTRLWARFIRDSSSSARAAVRPSAASGRPSPCSAATHAAAAASIWSFLRPPPRESCRTRAVAVDGTSTTRSPRATSHDDRCRPRLFSVLHRPAPLLELPRPPQHPGIV
jgi:hypothetical protein